MDIPFQVQDLYSKSVLDKYLHICDAQWNGNNFCFGCYQKFFADTADLYKLFY